ncbi:MAG: hypothetical protein M3O61_18295 [Gemmatimonadota bacterium]|nr:hypothetical protein [Gemmatimonadota bacterium]
MSFKRASLFALFTLVPAILGAQISGASTQMVAAQPLASYAQGQAMMAEAARKAALLDITFTFLDKEYKDDTYATDPLGNQYRTGCYRFKVNSGFRFKVDVPQFTLTNQGLTVTQNIARLNADGLSARAQVLACQEFGIGVGLRLSDLRVTYTARPMISFNQANGACTISWNQDTDDVRVTIGDLNILGVQNDLDKLAKNAVEDAVNLTLDAFFGSMMRTELLKISTGVCGQPKTRTR